MRKNETARGIIIAIAAALLLCGCAANPDDVLKDISDALGVDVSYGTVLTDTDTHGGFHGDGTAFTIIQFEDDACLDSIQSSPLWKPLPFSENLTTLAYGLEKGDPSHSAYYGPYLTDAEGKPLFPAIFNGYYYFLDRHPQHTDPQDDTDVLNRPSFNLTLAIYDADTDTLYYCAFDT